MKRHSFIYFNKLMWLTDMFVIFLTEKFYKISKFLQHVTQTEEMNILLSSQCMLTQIKITPKPVLAMIQIVQESRLDREKWI